MECRSSGASFGQHTSLLLWVDRLDVTLLVRANGQPYLCRLRGIVSKDTLTRHPVTGRFRGRLHLAACPTSTRYFEDGVYTILSLQLALGDTESMLTCIRDDPELSISVTAMVCPCYLRRDCISCCSA